VRVHARRGAPARPGRLPVVLFSPGFGAPRVLYQALAEDLASRGHLVIGLDHTGEAPVELPDGRIRLRRLPKVADPIAAASRTRLADLRLVLRRLDALPRGPRSDRRRIAAVGGSLGGSMAAALMRVEPAIDAGVDMDGSIVGTAARRGVPRPFLVMAGDDGLDASLRGLLRHSQGPRLALRFAGQEHASFTDFPVIAPERLGRRPPSARDIAAQRAYLGAFLDRYLRGRRAPLLDGPSPRWSRVRFVYRRRCCA
jgi:predicted dienelactone hydrolase